MYNNALDFDDPVGLRLNNYAQSFPVQMDSQVNPEVIDQYVDCDDENENPYLWHCEKLNIQANPMVGETGTITRLTKVEAKNHVYLTNYVNQKTKVKTHEIGEDKSQVVKLIFAQSSKEFMTFVFKIFNYESKR